MFQVVFIAIFNQSVVFVCVCEREREREGEIGDVCGGDRTRSGT